ncbi:MAG: hypothetical protein FWE95_05770 [Planctomycetaceae bacterium]|nr:hypothetical protein [Planctomycetaceae bacterium]
MNQVIARLAFRESGMYIVPIIIVLFAYVLLKLDPLRFFDTPIALLAALLGFFLAWRSFADYGNVRAFLFSRAFTPTQFFMVRWLFGIGTITAVGLTIAILLAFGTRQTVQGVLFANGWFPMVRFEELHVLMCYFFTALFVYHTTMYFVLTNRYRAPRRYRGIRWWCRGLGTLLLILIGIGVVLMLCYAILVDTFSGFAGIDYSPEIVPFLYLIFGVPVLTQIALAPAFGICCYRNLEIES